MQPRRPRKKRAATKQRPWLPVALVGGAAVAVVLLVVLISNVVGGSDGTSNLPAKIPPGPTASAPQQGASLGQPNAPVTMVEYYSFQCSHCADFAAETEPQIEKDYVDTGKVRIEFRALGSGDALVASEAASCVGDQGHYFDYYKYLFANRLRGFAKSTLQDYAADLNLDTSAFNQCLNSNKYEQAITNDVKAVSAQGNFGTPTFYIGKTSAIASDSFPYSSEKVIQGAETYAAFKTALDAALAAP